MATRQSVLASLSSAAEAARQTYLAALAANPGADLGALYKQEMAALDLWSEAEDKALDEQADGLALAQAGLDEVTKKTRAHLAEFKAVGEFLGAIDNLVVAATQVAGFFA